DTKVGTDKKDDPVEVAKNGFEAMMKGEGGVVSGLHDEVQAAAAHGVPAETLAKHHSKMAAPGTAKRRFRILDPVVVRAVDPGVSNPRQHGDTRTEPKKGQAVSSDIPGQDGDVADEA